MAETVAIEHEEHHHHHRGGSCPVCGHHNLTDGTGHGRFGQLSVALIGGYFILNSYLLNWLLPKQNFTAELSAIVGAVILAIPIIVTALKDLYYGKIYMNELVALAILAAFTGGDFRTAGIIAFFLLITIIIESRTASGAQRSIEELIKLTPHTARKIIDGIEIETEVLELAIGDVIRIRPGENFPVDGVIISGQSTVNQASITGESLPVDKSSDDDVYAGTQNLTGSLEVKVTKVGEDTTLGKVKEMILAAESSRTPIVRIIDRYAGYYTPTILMIAGVTWWLSGGDMKRVITLMVIACPCAIVLATPSAVVAAVAAAARLGILIKNVSHLELAAKIKAFVFDKTGTLTNGILSVARLNPVEGVEPAELLLTAASVESHSNHPTARALQTLAKEADLKLDEVSDFQEIHGKGVQAVLKNEICRIGRSEWLSSFGVNVSLEMLHDKEKENEESGMSVVYVAKGNKVLGWIAFKDKVRNEAAAIIKDLKKLGVRHCAMVTGDRESVAKIIASSLNIEEYRSECLPETKVEYVKNVKKTSTVAVVGDGVNDAPALAAGDLGIAMGAIGSDIAINSASIALMTNDLRRIPLLVSLSRKSRVIINQNLMLGMLFVVGGIILSVFGWMSPITAAVLHALSTLLVLFNSARLVRTGEEITINEHSSIN
ncbi:MAG: copper-translocating P-type ATPase [Lentisphaerae bacterium GWF2_44_16]|nr:MAG: copper-translocating P-type ATPase [Lentisphaerae bacterium GWF2_44_16]